MSGFVRPARFAGSWYPGDATDLAQFIESATPRKTQRERALALLAPHAGYRYSGAIAAETYAQVEVPESAIVLCPNHRVPPPVLAVWAKGSWKTPLGELPVDEPLAQRLLQECRGRLAADTYPHEQEHAVELQLPFLQYHHTTDLKVVPIVVGIDSRSEIEALGKAIANAIKAHDRSVLIVASTDMNHYESARIAMVKDELALERVLKLDPDGLLEVCEENDISMCGVRPTAAALHAALALGATRARLVRHGHSGETSGDDDSVVGYAGVVIL